MTDLQLPANWLDYSLAGITRGTFSLDRPLPSGRWFIPACVEPAGDEIRWKLFDDDLEPHTAEMGEGMLTSFVKLAEADADAVAEFARDWGPLGLCRHGLPTLHAIPPRDSPYAEWTDDFSPCALVPVADADPRDPNPWCVESVQDWQDFASQATSALRLATRLDAGELGEKTDWARLRWWTLEGEDDRLDPEEFELRLPTKMGVEAGWRKVQRFVWQWLRWGELRVAPRRADGASEVVLAPGSLVGALGVQLLFAVNRARDLAICDNCHRPYLPNRKPARGRRSFCQDVGCRVRAKNRLAKRDQRSELK